MRAMPSAALIGRVTLRRKCLIAFGAQAVGPASPMTISAKRLAAHHRLAGRCKTSRFRLATSQLRLARGRLPALRLASSCRSCLVVLACLALQLAQWLLSAFH